MNHDLVYVLLVSLITAAVVLMVLITITLWSNESRKQSPFRKNIEDYNDK
jgi:hypothetical protein